MKHGNWLITQEAFSAFAESMQRAQAIGITGIEDFFTQRPAMTIDQAGIAHIHAVGTLLNNPPNIEKVAGNTSYQDVQADFRAANEAGARGILFNIDSGGGMAEGAPETAESINSSEAPVLAFSEGYMCSAAYFLAAGADSISVTGSSTSGSIGTVIRWVDSSALLAEMGLKQGAYTNEGADLKVIDFANPTPEQKQFIQEYINDHAEVFQDFVSRNRPSLDAEVFRAGYYGGAKAQALGLVDHVESRESAYLRLLSSL